MPLQRPRFDGKDFAKFDSQLVTRNRRDQFKDINARWKLDHFRVR